MDTKTMVAVAGAKNPPNYGNGTDVRISATNRGEVLTVAGLPPYTRLVSAGQSWSAKTATAAAPVTAIPTTASLIQLWNGDPAKSYVMDSAFILVTAATAAVQAYGLLMNIGTAPVVAAIADTIAPLPML